MFYSPLVEIIEKFIKWAKEYGGVLYWTWIFFLAIFGWFTVQCLIHGYKEFKSALIITIILWIGFIPIAYLTERNRKKKK